MNQLVNVSAVTESTSFRMLAPRLRAVGRRNNYWTGYPKKKMGEGDGVYVAIYPNPCHYLDKI